MLYTKELADKLKKAIKEVEFKEEEDERYMFDVIATTEDPDRDNEVIKVNWWDTKNWEKNPVILANHDYTIQSIIGKWFSFYTKDWQKRLKWMFSKINPLWKLAKELYDEWMLKAVSVWFIPKKFDDNDPKIIEEAELLEVSFVAVWANANAVSVDEKLYNEALEKGFIKEEWDKEEWTEEEDTEEKEQDKSPACRQENETKKQCVKRKIPELINEWYEPDQAAAIANNMCETECSEKTLEINESDMEEVKQQLKEIKQEFQEIKSILSADGKANQWDDSEELQEREEIVRQINKGTADLLNKFKKL